MIIKRCNRVHHVRIRFWYYVRQLFLADSYRTLQHSTRTSFTVLPGNHQLWDLIENDIFFVQELKKLAN